MQRDVKVGVAVGLALVGIVGALFFRRDPIPEESPAATLQKMPLSFGPFSMVNGRLGGMLCC